MPAAHRQAVSGLSLVKFQGPFIWHQHENEDELFLVHKGRFTMEFRDGSVAVEEGEFIIVPRGIEHRPVADEEAHILLFEPATRRILISCAATFEEAPCQSTTR